jgi:phage tail protein X
MLLLKLIKLLGLLKGIIKAYFRQAIGLSVLNKVLAESLGINLPVSAPRKL